MTWWTLLFMTIGIATAVNWLFKLVERIEQ